MFFLNVFISHRVLFMYDIFSSRNRLVTSFSIESSGPLPNLPRLRSILRFDNDYTNDCSSAELATKKSREQPRSAKVEGFFDIPTYTQHILMGGDF